MVSIEERIPRESLPDHSVPDEMIREELLYAPTKKESINGIREMHLWSVDEPLSNIRAEENSRLLDLRYGFLLSQLNKVTCACN